MEPIRFLAGNEKRFYEFVQGLNEKNKIALLSHIDLDGITSAKIVNEVLNADYLNFVDYTELNTDLITKLKSLKIDKIVITDLAIDSPEFLKELEKFAQVLIIDHHRFAQDLNSEKTVYINPGGNNRFCAAYICYYLFSKLQKIEHWDWLVASACLADFATNETKSWLESVFKKYHEDPKQVFPNSPNPTRFHELEKTIDYALIYWKTKENIRPAFDEIQPQFGSIGTLQQQAEEVKKEIARLVSEFDEKKEEINGRFLYRIDPKFRTASKLANALTAPHQDKTLFIIRPTNGFYAISARRQDMKEDMNLLLKQLLSGLKEANAGGHIPAAGGQFRKEDLNEFIKRLKELPEAK